jgi:glycosyltransferase involved in cell wall biosynthesis
LADKPLVSVIVCTHNRHEALTERCLPSIAAQDYENIEVIVVSDGPDPWLTEYFEDKVVKYMYTGRNWHALSGVSWGTEPRTMAAFAAQGDYICYVDDDDTVTPDHVSNLVSALDGTQHWFALCQYQYPDGRVLGDGNVAPSNVGTCMIMFRPECLCASVLRPGSYLGDFEWIARMAQTGMSFTHAPKPTYLVGHALEQLGEKVGSK